MAPRKNERPFFTIASNTDKKGVKSRNVL